jgi:hypothetical protein
MGGRIENKRRPPGSASGAIAILTSNLELKIPIVSATVGKSIA